MTHLAHLENIPPTFLIRHRKENIKKCSLKGLESKPGFCFLRYPLERLPPLEHYRILCLEAQEELSPADHPYGLLLLDATWKYEAVMRRHLSFPATACFRRLPPGIETVYPRRQEGCSEPTQGLASIEALAAAYALLGRPFEPLLQHYHWKDSFLEKNGPLLLRWAHVKNDSRGTVTQSLPSF